MAMLRLLITHGGNVLWKCGDSVASRVTRRQVSSFLQITGVSHHRVSVPARHFSAGSPVWKDAVQTQPQSEESKRTLDLDGWKSVMRSQAAFEEKQVTDEAEGGDGEHLKGPGDDSPLEATRSLVALWRQAGKLVPQEMTDAQVQTLAESPSKTSKKKYLKFLAIKEGYKLARKEKQVKKRAERELRENAEEGDDDDDGGRGQVLKNALFLQFWDRSLDKLLAWRTAQAMVFGQPLVFDMSYESNMSRRELENTVSQLLEVEGYNRRAVEPYHLHFCNLQPAGSYQKELLKRYGAQTWERLHITSTDHQHVEVFPREQLVYLTADSPNVLRTFDHSKVYIIGALVDRSIQPGLSLANAKRLKLATARLPLDEFLHWEQGAKNLTLDQMFRIMLTLKDTGKWEEALKFVPTRKHDGFYQPKTKTNSSKAKGVTREDGDRMLRSRERDNGTSLKNNMEARKSAGKRKMWWQE